MSTAARPAQEVVVFSPGGEDHAPAIFVREAGGGTFASTRAAA